MSSDDIIGNDEELREEFLNPDEFPSEGGNGEGVNPDGIKSTHLTGMYKTWFLDYASYVILERAVPHIDDGLKPVQRRILQAMKRMDDGRYNKVANIIGFTMQYHPHGDASIGDALVQVGQKGFAIDPQGNWGNILTGDSAAAPRYIEARLTKFAHEVMFNPKTTQWKYTYDGRNKEPITLPMKFPLLLAQGVEGIAVGLSSKILPHNFNELIDASIAYLKKEPFELFPDFPTGGLVDVSRYNDGLRGGAIKVRARIGKIDSKTLVITEIPFGRTTSTLIESILKASEKGKIKIRKVDDNTAGTVEILIHLPPGISSDKTIDALYAFTDCELSVSPNACVIHDNRPVFLGVSDILRHNTDHTVHLLKRELEIRLNELDDDWHQSSLEKIFFEEKIYRELEKDRETWEAVIEAIDRGFDPYRDRLRREITNDDLVKLTEKPVRKISRFDIKKADEHIKAVEDEIKQVKSNIANIINFTIDYFARIKKNYGKDFVRLTEIRSFENIEAAKVVVKNEKLYINRAEGFIGTGLKKDEYVCDCSDIDDVIVIKKDGKYVITKVSEKQFFGHNILHVAVFKKNDTRTIYNVVYRDGKGGTIYVKRFAITGITRDKEYDITQGKPGSDILYFTANPNGEAEVLKITLKPKVRIRNLIFDFDMAELAIKGRFSMGNILTKNEIYKIALKRQGGSTLGGRKIWFDQDVLRLNADNRGTYLGEFHNNDQILVINNKGEFFTTNFDLSNHYEPNMLVIQKFKPQRLWTAIYYDAEQGCCFIKRFEAEVSAKPQLFISEHPGSKLLNITSIEYPRFELKFGGNDQNRPALVIDVTDFVPMKSVKAKGKKLSNYNVESIAELEPTQFPEEPEIEPSADENEIESEDDDEMDAGANQMKLDL